MDKCSQHDAVQTTVEAIERWKAVDTHRQDATEKKLDQICGSIERIEKWLARLEATLPATYETRADAEAAYHRLHGRIDTLRDEFYSRMTWGFSAAIGIASLFAAVMRFLV